MFKEGIQKTVDRLEGALAGILMGYDGIAVDSYTRDGQPLDIQTVGMEFSHIVSQVRKAADMLEVGGLHEVTIRADRLTVIIHGLNREYFVALALEPGGNFGKARYLMRLLAPQLRSEL